MHNNCLLENELTDVEMNESNELKGQTITCL